MLATTEMLQQMFEHEAITKGNADVVTHDEVRQVFIMTEPGGVEYLLPHSMRVTMTGVVNSHLSQLLLSASLEVSNQFLASLEETQSSLSASWLSDQLLWNCLESNGEIWSYYLIVSSSSGEM
jgi:hypothetical protein